MVTYRIGGSWPSALEEALNGIIEAIFIKELKSFIIIRYLDFVYG